MKKLLLLVSVLILNQFSVAGSEGVGGGDPDAVDFLLTAKTFNQWIIKSNIGFNAKEKQKIESTYQQLSTGMNYQALTPIRFVTERLTDLSGAPKVALYSKKPFLVKVNRPQWKSLNPQDKFIVVSLEIFGLADINDRYDVAAKIKSSINTLSNMKSDLQLLNFIVGSWTLAEGACLSGQPVHWGNPENSFADHQLNINFESSLSFSYELIRSGNRIVKSNGNFYVKDANLVMKTTEVCRYENGKELCEVETNSKVNGLLSIQNEQIWFLGNQGRNGGSCGPQDIFIMKYRR